MATLYGIRNCDTVKKARRWLDANGIAHAFHDYKSAGVNAIKLTDWVERFGWEALLNRAGTTFRKLEESDKTGLDRDRAIALMIQHPSAIRRPILDTGKTVLIGFEPERYAAAYSE